MVLHIIILEGSEIRAELLLHWICKSFYIHAFVCSGYHLPDRGILHTVFAVFIIISDYSVQLVHQDRYGPFPTSNITYDCFVCTKATVCHDGHQLPSNMRHYFFSDHFPRLATQSLLNINDISPKLSFFFFSFRILATSAIMNPAYSVIELFDKVFVVNIHEISLHSNYRSSMNTQSLNFFFELHPRINYQIFQIRFLITFLISYLPWTASRKLALTTRFSCNCWMFHSLWRRYLIIHRTPLQRSYNINISVILI